MSVDDLKSLGVGNSQYYNVLGIVDCLPAALNILLENVLRCGSQDADKQSFIDWAVNKTNSVEVAYIPSRVLMQDFTGVPAVVDLAAMRDAMATMGGDARIINPKCKVDLVIDHSVQVDKYGNHSARDYNTKLEMHRNQERYELLSWAQTAFANLRVVPPGRGICHQVNLEYLAGVVWQDGNIVYPDTVVGTDSHTTMINALGVLGWGVGGIEAEAAMLGQSIPLKLPDVIGVYLHGTPKLDLMATDIVLTITERLRKYGVVNKFVEFFGPGVTQLSLADRATIANMAPEYGSTCGFFPVDQETLDYLQLTGRSAQQIELIAAYAKAQGLWHKPDRDHRDYTDCIDIDLSMLNWSMAGPQRPQDRVNLDAIKPVMQELITDVNVSYPVAGIDENMQHGDVVIAAITSCTNTSNPAVLIAAGLLAKQAVSKGLQVKPWVKTSLAPGSRVVEHYLQELGLLTWLEQLGFYLVGFGCTTCIGNSGPLDANIVKTIEDNSLLVSAVLSGNRNFAGRIHPQVQANWLASPPLVVAFAIAGTTKIDLLTEPLGYDAEGNPVMLIDIWPKPEMIKASLTQVNATMFATGYDDGFWQGPKVWQQLSAELEQQMTTVNTQFAWQPESTYVRCPDFFVNMTQDIPKLQNIENAAILAVFGDSITTDHISPAGAIAVDGPAGEYLLSKQVSVADFNSFGARRGNHEVMMRGTFANIRIRNLLTPEIEGGYTLSPCGNQVTSIYTAAMQYRQQSRPLVVIAGKEYGTGSSRDWAAKGTLLLGVKCVIAESFERIHRSNLIGMGVLPCKMPISPADLNLSGQEEINILGIEEMNQPNAELVLQIIRSDNSISEITIKTCIDTPKELEYYRHQGILAYVLRGFCQS